MSYIRLMLSFTFQESMIKDRPHVTVKLGDMQWGDPLNDNAWVEDFYRYHDVFHLGMYALTGWSPVTEYFLGTKQPPHWDKRLEECLSITAFTEAKRKEYFKKEKPSGLVLRLLYDMTENVEALSHMTSQQWSETLVDIYGVFNQLVENRGGVVQVDPPTKTLRYIRE